MSELRIGNGLNIAMLPSVKTPAVKPAGQGFGDVLAKAVQEVNQLQKQADNAAEGLISGREANLHGTLVALEKADVSFKLMMKVRDKIVDAYREVMKMSV